MKDLTTFLWGFFLFMIGTITFALHNSFEKFWDYIWVILGLSIGTIGMIKIKKSTD